MGNLTLQNVRLSYAHIWEAHSMDPATQAPRFSASLLLPKTDTAQVQAVQRAIQQALQEGAAKFNGTIPPAAALKLPLRDGDAERADDPVYAGHWFLNANSKTRPQIVDENVQPILDQELVYSGCYVNVSLSFFAFNRNGNRGVAVGLGPIQKVRDGEKLGGGPDAASVFQALGGGAGYGQPNPAAGEDLGFLA